jgi:hypothetical protein
MESLEGAKRAITTSLVVTIMVLLASLVALGIAIAKT